MDTKLKILLYSLTTVLLWGAAPIIEKIGLTKASPFAGVTIRTIAIAIILLTIMIMTGRSQEVMAVGAKGFLLFCCSGILAGLLGMWTYFAALQMGEISRVVPISSAYPLVASFLGIIILREGFSLPRLLGTVLIISGVWLVITK
jgi:transporter family protein